MEKAYVNEGVATKNVGPQVDDGKKSGGPVDDGLNKFTTSAQTSSPVKQREYKCSDGRKRIIPEADGVPVHQENISGAVQSQAHDFPVMVSDHRKGNNGVVFNDDAIRATTLGGTLGRSFGLKERSGITARARISESLVVMKVPASAGRDGRINVKQLRNVMTSCCLAACSATLAMRVFDKKRGEDTTPICLDAHPREHAANDSVGLENTSMMSETEIICTKGGRRHFGLIGYQEKSLF